MKKKLPSFFLFLFILFFSTSAFAVLIVDTGEPPALGQGGSSWFYGHDQWLSSRFTLAQNYNITAMQGWIWEGISTNPLGSVDALSSYARVKLYGDGGTVPDVSNQLFNGQFSVPNNDPDHRPQEGATNPYDWHGVSGQSIYLSAGTYWIAFEVDFTLDTYSGAFGYPAPNDLAVESYKSGANPYTSGNFLDLSLRIYGDPAGEQGGSVVPEPSTVALLGLGLAALAVRKKYFYV